LPAENIPKAHPTPGVEIIVISGRSQGNSEEGLVQSPVKPHGGCEYYDIKLAKKGDQVWQPIPSGWTAFVYILEGEPLVNGKSEKSFHTVVLSSAANETGISLEAGSDKTRLVLIAGEPLDQPVVQMGPFVQTSREEIMEVVRNFQMGLNGFEKAPGWHSKIGEPLTGIHERVC